jgi:hypothetical protein
MSREGWLQPPRMCFSSPTSQRDCDGSTSVLPERQVRIGEVVFNISRVGRYSIFEMLLSRLSDDLGGKQRFPKVCFKRTGFTRDRY